jgi:valine dehydrogenase (NAD+)
MLAATAFRWGVDSLAGKRIGIIGIGKVGRHLIELATPDGATIVATDVNPAAVEWAHRTSPAVELVDDDADVTAADIDILAPCALGGAISDDNVDAIRAAVICGAANNQLVHDGLDNRLLERGILYCPDFVVNSGGVIQVADELDGFDFERAKAKTALIYDTTIEVLELAASKGVTPTEAATHIADQRMAAAR